MEENEMQQNGSESKVDLGNNSSTCSIENELESGKAAASAELKKDKITCSGDSLSSQIINVSNESEAKGKSQLNNFLVLKDVLLPSS